MTAHLQASRHVAHENSKQTTQRRTDAGDQQRVLDGFHAVGHDVFVVGEGNRVVDAPHLDDTAQNDDRVDSDDQGDYGCDDHGHDGRHERPRAVNRAASAGFTAHRHEVLAAYPVVLQQVYGESRNEQHERKRCAAFKVVHAGNLQISLCREHREGVSAQDLRCCEVGERTGENEKKRVGDAGNGKRHRDRTKDRKTRSAQRIGSVFQVRIDARENGRERHKRHREKGKRFGNEGAPEAVEVEVLDAQKREDHAVGTQEKRERDTACKGRRNQRQDRDCTDDEFHPSGHAQTRDGKGEDKAQNGTGQAYGKAKQDTVDSRLLVVPA